ncbi:conjugal transfer protein TraD, partial [Acinetobacter baumannii]
MGPRSFRAGRGELRQQLTATLAALRRNRTARNRYHAARARHDMRSWQIERRKRTRHLIELGGLVVKARIVELTG